MKNQSISLRGLRNAHFSSVIGKRGLFRDGDWVESKDQDPTGDVRLVQLADIGEGLYLNKSARFLTASKAKELRCTFLHPGDLLVARMPDPIGRACVFPGDPKPCVTAVDVCIVRPDPDLVDVQWLKRATNSPEFRFLLGRFTAGTTRKRISRKNLEQIPLTIPPLPEQRRIAAILDKADAIRRKRQEVIRLTEEFLRSAFLDMFGDPVTNPKGWPVKKLGQLLNFLTSGSRGWAKYYSQQGSIFLRIQNVGRNQLLMNEMTYVNPPDSAEARRTRVQEDDILLSITADLGRTAVVPPGLGSAYINQHLAILRVNGVEPIYLSAFLAGAGGQRQFKVMNREEVKAGLNFDNIQSVKVIVPPKHLQRRFVELYLKQGKALGSLSTIVEEDSRLFNSLVQRAFRGEL